MAYIAAILGVLGAVGSSVAGPLISANNAPGGTSPGEIQGLLGLESQFKPAGYSPALAGLETQNAYGIGASPDQLAMEIVSRQIEQASNSNVARKFQKFYSNLQTLGARKAAGQLSYKEIKIYNESLDKVQRILAARGSGANLSFADGGVPQLTLTDPAQQQMIDAARQNFSTIQANRLSGQQQLSSLAANYPAANAQTIQGWQDQFAKQLTGEINNNYGQQQEDILQQANTRGYNPAGVLGLLGQQQARDLQAVPQSAAARALQLIGGQQGLANNSIAGINAALAPDATIAIMNAVRGQQTPTTGQLAAAQIGANTTLAANQNSNFNQSLGQAGGDVAQLLALLGAYTSKQNAANQKAPEPNTVPNALNPGSNTGWGPGT